MKSDSYRKGCYFPRLAVYMPVAREEVSIVISSLRKVRENSRRAEKIIIIGQLETLQTIKKECASDNRQVFIESPVADLSAGVTWQLVLKKIMILK